MVPTSVGQDFGVLLAGQLAMPVPKPVVKSGVGSVKKIVVSALKGLRKRKSKNDNGGESKGSSSVKKV